MNVLHVLFSIMLTWLVAEEWFDPRRHKNEMRHARRRVRVVTMPVSKISNDPRLRALYEVAQESRQIAEADYLFYREARERADNLLRWVLSSGRSPPLFS